MPSIAGKKAAPSSHGLLKQKPRGRGGILPYELEVRDPPNTTCSYHSFLCCQPAQDGETGLLKTPYSLGCTTETLSWKAVPSVGWSIVVLEGAVQAAGEV